MKNKQPMGAVRALTVTKVLFWSGFGLMLLGLAIVSATDRGEALAQGLAFLGLLVCFGGVGFGFWKVRCPYCGKSLMAGGRIPSHIPNFCPECGRDPRDLDENAGN